MKLFNDSSPKKRLPFDQKDISRSFYLTFNISRIFHLFNSARECGVLYCLSGQGVIKDK